MMIGIEKISFSTSEYYMDLKSLARHHNIDPNKYYQGLMQQKMAINASDEDVITLAYQAILEILDDPKDIDLFIFASESATDFSKASSLFLLDQLALNHYINTYEIKQACYGMSAGIIQAINHVKANPDKRVLIVGSDIARYQIDSPGEATQGVGAVAMIISANPKIAIFNQDFSFYSENIHDFWRPSDLDYALVDGEYSTMVYQTFLLKTKLKHQITFNHNYNKILLHVPYTKLVKKSLALIDSDTQIVEYSCAYNQIIGNIYTGSLYLSLISLLDNYPQDLSKQNIALYSYGSGAIASFFTIQILEGYRNYLNPNHNREKLNNRKELSYQDYLNLRTGNLELSSNSGLKYQGRKNGIRIYQK